MAADYSVLSKKELIKIIEDLKNEVRNLNENLKVLQERIYDENDDEDNSNFTSDVEMKEVAKEGSDNPKKVISKKIVSTPCLWCLDRVGRLPVNSMC